MDEILQWTGSDGAKLCALTDGLGSTVALTDAEGAVIQRYRYDAYGAPVALDAGSSIPLTGSAVVSAHRFLFTGREWLGIAKVQDNRYRNYAASAGHWLQVDPLRLLGGDVNFSRYAKNHPVRLIDPMGLVNGPEFEWCCQNPSCCISARDSDTNTKKEMIARFGSLPDDNTWGNAVQHCTWMCAVTGASGCHAPSAVALWAGAESLSKR